MCVTACPKGKQPKLDKEFIKPENTKQQLNPQEKHQVSVAHSNDGAFVHILVDIKALASHVEVKIMRSLAHGLVETFLMLGHHVPLQLINLASFLSALLLLGC